MSAVELQWLHTRQKLQQHIGFDVRNPSVPKSFLFVDMDKHLFEPDVYQDALLQALTASCIGGGGTPQMQRALILGFGVAAVVRAADVVEASTRALQSLLLGLQQENRDDVEGALRLFEGFQRVLWKQDKDVEGAQGAVEPDVVLPALAQLPPLDLWGGPFASDDLYEIELRSLLRQKAAIARLSASYQSLVVLLAKLSTFQATKTFDLVLETMNAKDRWNAVHTAWTRDTVRKYMRILGEVVVDKDVPLKSGSGSGNASRITRSKEMQFQLSDPAATVLQVVKAVRLVGQIAAATVAEKVFMETYVRHMFASGKDAADDPPHLTSMLMTFLGIDAAVYMVAVLLLLVVSYAYTGSRGEEMPFAIDNAFFVTLMVEYALSTGVLLILGLTLAALLRRKRYFEYREQGVAVVGAYKDVLLLVSGVNSVLPYSALV